MFLFHFLQTITNSSHSPPIDVLLRWEQTCQPCTLNLPACTCGEGLGKFENSRGPAQAPAEQRGHKLFLQLQPDISWTSCTCRGKTHRRPASSVKSTALYQSTEECEWRIRITKLTDIPENEWKSNKNVDTRMFNLWDVFNFSGQSHDEQYGKQVAACDSVISWLLFLHGAPGQTNIIMNGYTCTSVRVQSVSSQASTWMTWIVKQIPVIILIRSRFEPHLEHSFFFILSLFLSLVQRLLVGNSNTKMYIRIVHQLM